MLETVRYSLLVGYSLILGSQNVDFLASKEGILCLNCLAGKDERIARQLVGVLLLGSREFVIGPILTLMERKCTSR
jgi:hypothetical protein